MAECILSRFKMRLDSQICGFMIAVFVYGAAFWVYLLFENAFFALLSRPTPFEVTSIALSHFSESTNAPNHANIQKAQNPTKKHTKHKENLIDSQHFETHKAAENTEKAVDSNALNSSQAMQTSLAGENIDEYALKIYQALDANYYYPHSMRERGVKGEVVLGFRIAVSGALISSEILKSDDKRLEAVAVRILNMASKSFPKPENERIMRVTLGFGTKRNLR